MSLRIGTLVTNCRASRGREAVGALVDGVARERLPDEIAARLGPSLDREAAVVRLRGLDVRVRIDTASLRRGALAEVWAAAVVHALHEALARPDGDGTRLRRFDGKPDYVAAMIAAVAGGAPPSAWQFPEAAARADRPPGILIVDLMIEAGPLLGEVLEVLLRRRALDGALAALDELGLERLIRAVALAEGGDGTLAVADVLAVAARLAEISAPPQGDPAGSRRQAVRLWLALSRALPLRGVWNAIRLLLVILERPSLLAPAAGRPALPDDLPAWCEEAVRALARDPPAGALRAIDRLREITPTAVAARPGAAENWLASDCAGMLLLCDTIRRLGWMRLLRDAGHGPRIVQAMLVGMGMRLRGGVRGSPPWEPGRPVEPAVGLLAGMSAEADPRGVARVFAETSPAILAGVAEGEDWLAALDRAGDALAARFTAGIRGFRKADRESVVRHFLRRPGRILVGDTALRVVLKPNPFAVALHISGADAPVPGLDWLGGRHVEFVLEGL